MTPTPIDPSLYDAAMFPSGLCSTADQPDTDTEKEERIKLIQGLAEKLIACINAGADYMLMVSIPGSDYEHTDVGVVCRCDLGLIHGAYADFLIDLEEGEDAAI